MSHHKNPPPSGDFEAWLTNKNKTKVMPPKAGNTGGLGRGPTGNITWVVYVEAGSAIGVTGRSMRGLV